MCDEPLTYLWCAGSIGGHPSVTPHDEARCIRAEGIRCARLTALSSRATRLELVTWFDPKGVFPAWLVHDVLLPQMMRMPAALQTYFMMVVEGDSYIAEDGRIIAHLMLDSVRYRSHIYMSKKLRKRQADDVAKFVLRTAMIHDAPFGHLCDMLTVVVSNTYHRVREVEAHDPALLTQAEARAIGESFKAVRLSHLHAHMAMSDLLHRYPALRAFSQTNVWFAPMLETVLRRQSAASFRERAVVLLVMMGLSLFDVVTDIASMAFYFRAGDIVIGLAVTGFVLLSQALQATVVVVKNLHCGWQVVLKEVAIVFSFIKPTVDASRLLRGHEVAGAPFNTQVERDACKVIEMVVESIPTMLLQLVQNISAGGAWPFVTATSIAVAWLSTATKTALMAIKMDRNPRNRLQVPTFYGFVPDGMRRRAMVHAFLTLLTLAHVIGRSLAISLLYVTEPA